MSEKLTALVTGASGGIGEEIARRLAADGHDLVLVARSEPKLRELATELSAKHKIEARVITCDLAKPDAAAEVVGKLDKMSLGSPIDILINNAGYASYGAFAETELSSELSMIQVNIVTLTHLTKLLLPGMIARKRGRVLNVASTAAFQPGPLMAVYYATKAYVLSLSEALANEVLGSGVTVTALCPGPTKTGFQARAKMEESKLLRGKDIMSSAEVAKAGVDGMMRGKTVVVPGAQNRLMTQAVRFLPRNVVTRMVRSAQERNPG
jgi:short-subunit dehydrogenase